MILKLFNLMTPNSMPLLAVFAMTGLGCHDAGSGFSSKVPGAGSSQVIEVEESVDVASAASVTGGDPFETIALHTGKSREEIFDDLRAMPLADFILPATQDATNEPMEYNGIFFENRQDFLFAQEASLEAFLDEFGDVGEFFDLLGLNSVDDIDFTDTEAGQNYVSELLMSGEFAADLRAPPEAAGLRSRSTWFSNNWFVSSFSPGNGSSSKTIVMYDDDDPGEDDGDVAVRETRCGSTVTTTVTSLPSRPAAPAALALVETRTLGCNETLASGTTTISRYCSNEAFHKAVASRIGDACAGSNPPPPADE